MAPNTSQAHIHSHTRTTGPPLRADLAVPPYCSALACVQNKLGLSVGNGGGLRPCCLAGAEGEAGCQWSVPAGASGNGVTLAHSAPLPPSSSSPDTSPASSWVQDRVQRSRNNSTPTNQQLDELSWMSSFWPTSKEEESQTPDVWAASMKSHCESCSSSSSDTLPCTQTEVLRLEVQLRPEQY